MKTLADATKLIVKEWAKLEDSAVSEYIRQQAQHITASGGNLEDYYLIRDSGNFTFDDGKTVKSNTYWGLVHKDKVKKIETVEL